MSNLNRQKARSMISMAVKHEVKLEDALIALKSCRNPYRCLVSEALTGRKGALAYSTCRDCVFNRGPIGWNCWLDYCSNSEKAETVINEVGEARIALAIIKIHAGLEATGLGE